MKKVISLLICIILIFSYCSCTYAALSHSRTGGTEINSKATYITNDTYIDSKYNVEWNGTEAKDVEIYDYSSNTKKICTGNREKIPYEGNTNKYYYAVEQNASSDRDKLYYAINLGAGEQNITDVATFFYKNQLKIDGELYNVKLNLRKIYKEGDSEQEIRIRIGSGPHHENESDLCNIEKYDLNSLPSIEITGSGNNTEVEVDYLILNQKGETVTFSGVFKLEDIDQAQGIYIEEYHPSKSNTYMYQKDKNGEDINTLYCKDGENGTYVYSNTTEDSNDRDIYMLLDNTDRVKMSLTFEQGAESAFSFSRELRTYHKIETEVINGKTSTPLIDNIKDGESKTTNFSPNDSEKQYLKSITIDGKNQTITGSESNQTFSNIENNHKVVVEYDNKNKVTFDPKGGAPTPSTQYIIPGKTATQPNEPTKNGYIFKGWQKPDGTGDYDFNTPVTKDIELPAKWEEEIYNINYVLNGGTNNSSNPSTYRITDTINFKDPTRQGFVFKGWYEDAEFKNRKDGISNETGDKTIYAKWEKKEIEDVKYKVEHYKENQEGDYTLATTEEKTGTVGKEVQATAKNFTGFQENTTHKDRIATGTIEEDGSLVLKLYYDKLNYNVTFDTQGGTPVPEKEVVAYQDKVKEPTKPQKNGYTFEYWYYKNDKGEEVRYNFDDLVTKDINLIAKWEPINTNTNTNTNNTDTSFKDNKTTSIKGYDNTVATKQIPYAGKHIVIIGFFVVVLLIIFGIRYFKLKDVK